MTKSKRLMSRGGSYSIGIFILLSIAATTLLLTSTSASSLFRAGSANSPRNSSSSPYIRKNETTRKANTANWVNHAVFAETIETFAADCTTSKSAFTLGETVCAKTDGVDLNYPGGRWVHWLRQNLSIAYGGSSTTLIINNPQTFTFVPDQLGTWKVTIAETGDISQTPAVFTVNEPEGDSVAIYQSDCTTPATSFNLGETVCAKISNAPIGLRPQRRLSFENQTGYIAAEANITSDPQTLTFTLPATATSPFGNDVVDNRGQWKATDASAINGGLVTSIPFFVRDPAVAVGDLAITNTLTGSNLVAAGSNVSFSVMVENYGPDAATNVQFTDSVPSGATFAAAAQNSGPAFTCSHPSAGGTGTSTCTIATLNRGAVAKFTITYQVNGNATAGASITTVANASSATFERNTADNTSKAGAQVIAAAGGGTCTISCPADITVTAPLGQSGATVTFANPTTSGSCSSVSVTPVSGSFFAIGSSVVTATTEAGESCSFLVTVNPADDTEAPTISCPADITVDESSPSANSAIVTYNVTATDNSGSADVSCDPPSGSSFAIGTHQVVCTATDAKGNTATCSFNVTVNQVGCDIDANSPAPTPSVASLPTLTAACSVTLLPQNDPTATDACGGTINGDTTDDRTYDTPGTYTVHWTYTDSAGHVTTQNQTIIIQPDNTAPVPDIASLPTVTGECSVNLTAPTATDNCAGTLTGTTANMVIEGAGTHTVVWTYTDNAGNITQQNQTVVVTDTSAPVVTLTGASSVTVECHTSYTDAGATASDNCSPPPTPTASSNVDVNTPGTYQVTWSATDAGGNIASATRTVVVVDTTAPVITLNGPSSVTVECHTSFTDPGASAVDSCDTSVPVNIAGTVNANAVGSYTLNYSAVDDSGNAATTLTRTVNVVDTTAPAVTLNGAAVMTVILGSSFTDPGATASDSCTGALAVTVSGTVNTNAIGSYTLTYSATDASSNTGTATRTVNVIYNFTGFFSPVANPPTLNAVNAGRAIPVKFSLSGNQGLNIFAANNPYTVSLNCATNDPGVDVTETLTAGASSLSYSPDTYTYVWKTESSWAGTCRQLVITLNDGTVHSAYFKFK